MIASAFIFGLISSLHCIGMCGPIALMLPVDHNNPAKKATQLMTYHIGRLSSYAIIGLIFGLVGRGLYLAGIQQRLSIFIGLAMIVVVLLPERLFAKHNFSQPVFRVISKLKSALGVQFRNKTYKSLFTIGLLNGFLPCGMVYVALFGAIAMQHTGYGILFMVLFGLGTIPLMSTVVYLDSFVTLKFRNRIRQLIPYAAVVMGMLFVLRGLGLGIPYVSPSDLSLFVQSTPQCF